MSVLVVGSIAIDTVKTPVEEHSELLGGSASYAALGASFFSPVRLVGIVGNDFPESEFEFWKSRKIDSEGVQRANGNTFRWSGEYSWDLNTRETRSIALNVFEDFKPALPESYRETDFVLLANIAPSMQAHVLDQMQRHRFVVADTMDLGTVKKVHFNDLRRAIIYGSVLASFCVEAFSLDRLRTLSMEEIAKRYETFKLMSQFEVPL